MMTVQSKIEKKPDAASLDSAKAPLVIAVTGHRDLRPEDIDKLKAAVANLLRKLRASYPLTPFILLSPLAEGADRLVASVAQTEAPGTRLVIPLPMPEKMYLDDFSPNSIKEFREIADDHTKFALNLLSPESEVTIQGSTARNLQYEAVGKYIVRQSQILLALWDGEDSVQTGSTAQVVRFQIKGIPQKNDDLQPLELFPVHHIVTPHYRNPVPRLEPFAEQTIYPAAFENKTKDAENYYHKIFDNLEKFNKGITRSDKRFRRKVIKSREDLVTSAVPFTLSTSEEDDLCRYAVADAMAIRFHDYVKWANRTLQALVFFSFFSFVFFAHHPDNPPLALIASFAFFVMGYAVQAVTRYKGVDSRSQDYRALAEACRVRFFWRVAGIRMAGIQEDLSNDYLGMQRTELDWIRNTLRAWSIVPEDSARPELERRLQFIQARWVDNQLDFFKERSETEEKTLRFSERTMKHCVQAALALAFISILSVVCFHYDDFTWRHCPGCDDWLFGILIPIDLLLASAALLHHSMQRRALAQHVKQYKRMKVIFQKASELLRRYASDTDAVKECLRQLGQEALKENGDWVLLHRERPSVLPHP